MEIYIGPIKKVLLLVLAELQSLRHEIHQLRKEDKQMANTVQDLDDAITAAEAESAQFQADVQAELQTLQNKVANQPQIDLGPEIARIQALVAAQVKADPGPVATTPAEPTNDGAVANAGANAPS